MVMKKSVLLIALTAMLLVGCKSNGNGRVLADGIVPAGVIDTTLMDVKKKYTAIEADAVYHVVYSDSVKCLLLITDSAVMPYVDVRVEKGTLHLGFKPNANIRGPFDGVTVWVPYDAKIKEIELSGASSFQSRRPLVGSSFELELSGASTARCFLDMPDGNLKVDVSGASQVEVTGSVRRLEADVSGSSHFLSRMENGQYTFSAGNVELDVSGSSEVLLHCDGDLRGELSGASLLDYTGKAKSNRVESSGFSKIQAATAAAVQ